MRIKEGWILTKLGDDYIVVPEGGRKNGFRGIIRLNGTGLDIWNGLSEGKTEEEIAEALVEKYTDLDSYKALEDVRNVIGKLQAENLLEG